MNRRLLSACLAAAMLTAACADPPNKEMDQAQGAIDAAGAAGADRYAAAEYSAAVESLKRSQLAVTDRDYRLALNNALESREHAQNAAREAADAKAQVLAEVERSMAAIASTLAEANSRFQAAERARVSSRLLDQPRRELAGVNTDVQKAGEAIKAGDYLGAKTLLDGVKPRIAKIVSDLQPRPTSQSTRRRR